MGAELFLHSFFLCYAVREKRDEQEKVEEEERFSVVGDRVSEAAGWAGMLLCPPRVESRKRKSQLCREAADLV